VDDTFSNCGRLGHSQNGIILAVSWIINIPIPESFTPIIRRMIQAVQKFFKSESFREMSFLFPSVSETARPLF